MNTQDNQGNGWVGGGIGALLGGGLVAALPNAPIDYYMDRTGTILENQADDITRNHNQAIKDMYDLKVKYGDDLFPDLRENFSVRREARNPEAAKAYQDARKVRDDTGPTGVMRSENKARRDALEKFPSSTLGQSIALLYRLGVPITAALIGSTLTD